MLSWTEVENIAGQIAGLQLVAGAQRSWIVNGKTAAWERPLSKKDLAALGASAPTGPVLAIHAVDLPTKLAWIETEPASCFDSPHFNGYPAVLVNLDTADAQVVFELLAEAAVL